MIHSVNGPVSRRTLLKGAAAIAATSLIAPARPIETRAQAAPTRISLAEFVQSDAKLESLRRGISEMKSRRPSDPKGWFFQGAVHGVTDEAVEQALQADPGVAAVDQANLWNQCPHFGQNSANFLLWHRAYLYYFERILREASGDPAFALPYWNYLEPAGRRFPRDFSPKFLDEAETILNPLHHAEREQAFTQGVLQLTEAAVDVRRARAERRFFGPNERTGFAGGIGDDDPGTQGLIENIPHNMIHFAVGGAIGSAAGAMASVPTAAFDPIFWVHHSMIDRLWVEWMCLPERNWGAFPGQGWFDETPWSFVDVDGDVRRESRGHFIDHRQLGYRYDTEDVSCEPLPLPDPAAFV